MDRRGNLAGVYRKTHPFGDERKVFAAGDELLVDLNGVRVGIMICFDVEFPEVARSLAVAGADLLITISANMAGARGYVLKDDDKDDVLGAIRTVGRGGAVFGPGVAARLTNFLTTARPAVPRESFPALTDREREMLHLMAKGASNAEIARLLSLSPKTVANYVSNVLHKLQVADRKQAAARAREAGMGGERAL